MARNSARLAGGAAVAAALAVVVIALFPRFAQQTQTTVPSDARQSGPAVDAAPVPTATPDAPVTGPTVDTFLLGPDGVAVVAGHGTPGARITLLLDGAPLAEAQADAAGNFAATAEVAASDKPRSLTFAENDGAPAGEAVLVRPGAGAVTDHGAAPATQAPAIADAPAETLAEADPVQDVADAVTSNAPSGAAAAVTSADTAIAAPTIVVDNAGARVLGPGPQVMDRVALDAITYDAQGGVQLAGRAPGDGTLQVYIDNTPVIAGPVGTQGDWRVALPDIEAGTYTLRIDALAADGSVASRVETPFRREAPGAVAALQTDGAGMTVTTQTVQPGNTLWAIARDNLGEGTMYVAVFAANADQIRDPDLIYPGQVFVIPDR